MKRNNSIRGGLFFCPGTPWSVPLLLAILPLSGFYPAQAYDLHGHGKLQTGMVQLPADSLLQDFSDDPQQDSNLDIRLKYSDNAFDWYWFADYQFIASQGDALELQQLNPGLGFTQQALPDDEFRVFDLSHRISEDSDRIITHRLDRFYLSHRSDNAVFNIGRQAVSWGNGLIYNPVDFFNPFDPASIDTEYKTGDDMIYTQYLLESGDDLQAVWVGRRDDDGDISAKASSLAFKYHGFADTREFDLLLAEHYQDEIVALGASLDIADAIWRGDIMLSNSDGEKFTSLVLNASYSWTAWNHNINASIEYFRNGFGIDDGVYDPVSLAANSQLRQRIERGELFTLGQDYLAASAMLELTPLWILTANLFHNLNDHSGLLQIFSQQDLQQDLQLLIALNLPHGSDGSEFGGIDSGVPNRPLSFGVSLLAQLAWYY